MLEKLLNLKKNKKWLFYLLIIPIGVLLLIEGYKKYILGSAKDELQDAEEKDQKLKKEQDKLEEEAKKHEAKADSHADRREEIDKEDDEDWHKKV